MQLQFISRNLFSKKTALYEQLRSEYPNAYLIEEGGMNDQGILGSQEIMKLVKVDHYTHVCCAVGTGTMLAGIANSLFPSQRVVGISALKISNPDNDLLTFFDQHKIQRNKYEIHYDYHFGGYAKYNSELLNFMNEWYRTTFIPTDFVYTGKVFFAMLDLIKKSYFAVNDSILVIHSGGLQGNCSLAKGQLLF